MTDRSANIRPADVQLGTPPDGEARIYLFGGFQIAVGVRTLNGAQIRLHKARDLLKLLALSPDHRLAREQVLEALWPEQDPQKTAHSLNQLLYQLRPLLASLDPALTVQQLDDHLLLASPRGIWTDVEAFENAARSLSIHPDPAECQGALTLYRGDLLPDDLYSDLFDRRREELRSARQGLLRQLAQYHVSQREYAQALDLLRPLVESDPADEENQLMLVKTYASAGQRPQALRQYQHMQDKLRAEYGVEPSAESQRMYAKLQQTTATPTAQPPARGNLPQELSSFIGREEELKQIRELVRANRLVTLTGAGGVGKTRLGLRAAAELLQDFPDGLFWVPLAPLVSESMLLPAVMETLGMRGSGSEHPIEQIVARLRDQAALLILDNTEHLLPACSHLVEALLKGCPRLHVLVTSRVALSLQGEMRYRVPSLGLPPPDQAIQPGQVEHFPALRLFEERARQKNTSFQITSQNLEAVIAVCRRLDGIPLAIELAAARMRLLTVQQLAARLDNLFSLLTGGEGELERHQTLKATIQWSYQLLQEKEQLLLQRLCVFAGCWDLEAAEAVCAGEDIQTSEVLDLLGSLADQSLVDFDFEVNGVAYYRMLETVRQFAQTQMDPIVSTELRDQHLAYFAAYTDQADTTAVTAKEVALTDHFYAHLGNLRTALDWSLTHSVTHGMRLAANLAWFWDSRGLGVEGIDWWLRLLDAEEASRGSQPLEGERKLQRARALRYLPNLINYYRVSLRGRQLKDITGESLRLLEEIPGTRGLRERALTLLHGVATEGMSWVDLQQQAMDIFQSLGEESGVLQATVNLGIAYFCRGDYDNALHCYKRVLELGLKLGDYLGIGIGYIVTGEIAVIRGDYESAEKLYPLSLSYHILAKNHWDEANIYARTMMMRVAQGRYNEADQQGQIDLGFQRDFHEYFTLCWVMGHLARCAWSQGDYPRALQYCQDGLALTQEVVSDPSFIVAPRYILGRVALSQKDFFQAASLLRAVLLELMGGWNPVPFDLFLESIALLLVQRGQTECAAMLLGKTAVSYQKTVHYQAPRERSEHDEALALVRAALTDEQFTWAFEHGSKLNQEQAGQVALAGLDAVLIQK